MDQKAINALRLTKDGLGPVRTANSSEGVKNHGWFQRHVDYLTCNWDRKKSTEVKSAIAVLALESVILSAKRRGDYEEAEGIKTILDFVSMPANIRKKTKKLCTSVSYKYAEFELERPEQKAQKLRHAMRAFLFEAIKNKKSSGYIKGLKRAIKFLS